MSSSGGLTSTAYGNGWWISASGIRDANLRMGVVAHNVANGSTDGFAPDRVDSEAVPSGGVTGLVVMGNAGMLSEYEGASLTDYATEGVNLILAKRAFEANTRTLKAESETSKTLIEAFG